jgi:hypothetical protein
MEIATQRWRQGFLPKYNDQAKHAWEVYNAIDMVNQRGWTMISQMVESYWSQEDTNIAAALMAPSSTAVTDPTNNVSVGQSPEKATYREHELWGYPSIRALLNQVAARNGKDCKNQLKCLVLLNYYVNLYMQLHRKPSLNKGSSPGGIPRDIWYHFLDKFTTPLQHNDHSNDGGGGGIFLSSKFVMAKPDKDRFLVHILLLWIMGENGTLMRSDNIQPLAEDLKIDVQDASHLLRQAGFTVQRTTGTNAVTAVLKTPLTFPTLKRKKSRAKK